MRSHILLLITALTTLAVSPGTTCAEPFVAAVNDTRPHLVMLIGEDEYRTRETLPKFAGKHLGRDYRVTIVHASVDDPNTFPAIETVENADLLLISVRRRTLPPEQLGLIRAHVAAGKPVIGLRTASHAFTLREAAPPAGHAAWPEFDAQVFGGHYTGHHDNDLVTTISVIEKQADHPILAGVPAEAFTSHGSLYIVSPLAAGTTPFLLGRVPGHDPEPVAWTFTRSDGGKSFYTSLGHIDDFETPAFVGMLKNAIDWAAETSLTTATDSNVSQSGPERGWVPIQIPQRVPSKGDDPSLTRTSETARAKSEPESSDPTDLLEQVLSRERAQTPLKQPVWFRCFVKFGPEIKIDEHWGAHFVLPCYGRYHAWWNGQRARNCDEDFYIPKSRINDGLNTFVIRASSEEARDAFLSSGVSFLDADFDVLIEDFDRYPWNEHHKPLAGIWQHRIGDDPPWSDIPQPSTFAVPTNASFEVK